jgi:hypothetical protein
MASAPPFRYFFTVPKLTLIYDFEQAASLEQLQEKADRRVAEGWIVCGEPRQFDVKVAPDFVQPRYSQTFQRQVTVPDPELAKAPGQSSNEPAM